MKKTVLTFVAVAFGTCVAFAQTTPETDPQQNTEQTVEMDRMSDTAAQKEAGRRPIAVEELPEAVQRSLQNGEFKAWKVVSAAELPANGTSQVERENVANVTEEGQDDAAVATEDATTEAVATGAEEAAVVYEVELVAADAQADAEGEEALEEGAEKAAVAQEGTEAAAATVVVVRFDQQGNMLSRTERPAGQTIDN